MNAFRKYIFLFLSGIILIASLLLLVAFGMTPIVIVLLSLGVLGCLIFSFIYLLGKGEVFARADKKSKAPKNDRPTLLTIEKTYELKSDYVEPEEEQPKKKKSTKNSSKHPVLKTGDDWPQEKMPKKKKSKEESTPTKTCPYCKYKNYSTENNCQNCGAKLK